MSIQTEAIIVTTILLSDGVNSMIIDSNALVKIIGYVELCKKPVAVIQYDRYTGTCDLDLLSII